MPSIMFFFFFFTGHIVGVVVSHLEIPETFVDRQYRILFYNINNLEQCIFSINRKYQYVLRIQFWYTDHRLIAIIKDFRKLIFYDIEKQQEIRCDELIIDDYYDTLCVIVIVSFNLCENMLNCKFIILQSKSKSVLLCCWSNCDIAAVKIQWNNIGNHSTDTHRC